MRRIRFRNIFDVVLCLLTVYAIAPFSALAQTTGSDDASAVTEEAETQAESNEDVASMAEALPTAVSGEGLSTPAGSSTLSASTGSPTSTSTSASSPTAGSSSTSASAGSPTSASTSTSSPTSAGSSVSASGSSSSQALEPEGAADVTMTVTTDQTAYANGEYASFKVNYTLDYGKVKEGDTITVTVPDVLTKVNVAYSKLHFSACNDLGNGTYQLVFNGSAPAGLSGYFSINAFATNTSTSNKTGTLDVGGQQVTVSVSPTPGGSGPDTETRAIEKWAPDGTGYTQTTAISGIYGDGATVRFAFEADPRCSSMKNVIVTDTLPDELEFVAGSIVIERTLAADKTTTTLSDKEAAQFIKSQGQNLEFDFGDMDGTYYYRVYYKAKVVAGTNVVLTNTAHINYDDGTIEASTFTLKPANDAGAAVGYKKVDKTIVTEDPTDQTVTYTITFKNDNAFAVGEIDLADTLDSNVGYVTAYGTDYFSVTWDSTAHAVKIKNTSEIPASMTQTVTIVTDFTNVPVNTTVTNTVGGNTVKTKKTPSGKLALSAVKTIDGTIPRVSQKFSFNLVDASGKTLQTKQNDGGVITFDTIYYGKDDLGKTFTYTVFEAEPPAGYIKDSSVYTVTVTPTLDADNNIVATPIITKASATVTAITFDNKVDTVSKSVTKTWSDSDDYYGVRPQSVQVQLYADSVAKGDPVTLDATGDWTYTWTGLVKESGGAAIDYTVAEVAVPTGYSATVTDDGTGSAFGIANTLTTHDVTVSKTDINTGHEIAGAHLTVANAAGKTVAEWDSVAGSDQTVKLPVGTYTLTETNVPEGYAAASPITFTVASDGTVTSTTEGVASGTKVTMKDAPTTKSVSVTKTWTDGDNADGMRASSVTVHLFSNGVDTNKTLTLSADNSWTGSFTNLPAYADGAKVTYSVTEDVVSGYTTSITATGDAFSIVNTHGAATTSVNVTKVWSDSSNSLGLRPASVTVHLLANGIDTGKTLALSADNNWTGSFTDLPKNAAQKVITYTVTEDVVNGYTAQVTTTAGAGAPDAQGTFSYTITNTLTKPVTPATPTTPSTPSTPATPATPLVLPKTGDMLLVPTCALLAALVAGAAIVLIARKRRHADGR